MDLMVALALLDPQVIRYAIALSLNQKIVEQLSLAGPQGHPRIPRPSRVSWTTGEGRGGEEGGRAGRGGGREEREGKGREGRGGGRELFGWVDKIYISCFSLPG